MRAVQSRGQAVAVVVTKLHRLPAWIVAIFYAAFGMSLPLMAAILPEDRFDILYHSYDGDSVEVDGPSILGRTHIGKSTSIYGNYYTDSVTSASIDVRLGASPYTEDREEKSVGVDYLTDNTTISVGYTNSEEDDYSAKAYHLGLSHEMFGNLTTISLGFSFADDAIRKNRYINGEKVGTDPTFGEKELKRRHYRLAISQIMSTKLIMNLAFEGIADEGYTQNPYRSAILDVDFASQNVTFDAEYYPETRTSNAIALRASYFLPYRAAIKTEIKYYKDTWDIEAQSYKISYTHPFKKHWVVDLHYRWYQQDEANFYYDVVPGGVSLTYQGRDKELSLFSSQSFGFGVTYEFLKKGWWHLDKAAFSIAYDHIEFDYDNFSDYSQFRYIGDQKTNNRNPNFGNVFSFSADVLQLYFSVWF